MVIWFPSHSAVKKIKQTCATQLFILPERFRFFSYLIRQSKGGMKYFLLILLSHYRSILIHLIGCINYSRNLTSNFISFDCS
jgi:hypothetical protein